MIIWLKNNNLLLYINVRDDILISIELLKKITLFSSKFKAQSSRLIYGFRVVTQFILIVVDYFTK